MTEKIKQGDYVRIKSGKFRGLEGHVMAGSDIEHGYYDISAENIHRRKGDINPNVIGLGSVIDIRKSNLKKVS